ncbi:MAG: hypothetical protein ACTSVA_03340 [Candidatus Njordarchaeales archaeon]
MPVELEIEKCENKYCIRIVTLKNDIVEYEVEKVVLNNEERNIEYLYVSEKIKIMISGSKLYIKSK